jgi:tetratricopeptide (TPR) repeat protein
MPILAAEIHFKKGLAALVDHDYREANERFRRAVEIDQARSKQRADLRYLSYYGLSLAKSGLSVSEAVRVCRVAVAKDRNQPVLWLNLGRVYRAAGKTELALEALDRAASIAPDNAALARELAELDRRGAPVLPSLPRTHPLNVILGKALHSMRRARREAQRTAPAARA